MSFQCYININRLTIFQFIYLIIVSICAAVTVNHWCPKECECTSDKTVCNKGHYNIIPSLRKITSQIEWRNLILDELDLSDTDSFSNLTSIKLINLTFYNIHKNFFAKMPQQLKTLEISGCCITYFPNLDGISKINNVILDLQCASNSSNLFINGSQVTENFKSASHNSQITIRNKCLTSINSLAMTRFATAFKTIDISHNNLSGNVIIDAPEILNHNSRVENILYLNDNPMVDNLIVSVEFNIVQLNISNTNIDVTSLKFPNLIGLYVSNSTKQMTLEKVCDHVTKLHILQIDFSKIDNTSTQFFLQHCPFLKRFYMNNIHPKQQYFDFRTTKLDFYLARDNNYTYFDLSYLPSDIVTVDLSNNIIEELFTDNIIENMPNLDLRLSNNKLRRFPDTLKDITINGENVLDISNNPLKEFYKQNFTLNQNFRLLTLNMSSIEILQKHSGYIPSSFFRNFQYIRKLFLENNNINDILNLTNSLVISGLSHNLTDLNLASNHFQNISNPNTFITFTMLSILNLDNCFISFIDINVFENTPNLQELSLQNNYLHQISSAFLPTMLNELTISIAGNPINCIEKNKIFLKISELELCNVSETSAKSNDKACESISNVKEIWTIMCVVLATTGIIGISILCIFAGFMIFKRPTKRTYDFTKSYPYNQYHYKFSMKSSLSNDTINTDQFMTVFDTLNSDI